MAVDRFPAVVGDQVGLALVQQDLDGSGVGVGNVCGRTRSHARDGSRVAGGKVGKDRVDRLLSVLLVRANHSRRSALDPADDVLAGKGKTRGGVEDATAVVGDRAGGFVEGDVGKGDAAVADRSEEKAAGDRLTGVGGLGAQAAAGSRDEAVADGSTAPRWPESPGRRAVGESRKRRTMRRGRPDGAREA